LQHVSSLLLGLGNGGTFAALALAIVLTYRSSGVINFATGAIALYAAYTYAAFREGNLLVLIPGLPSRVDLGTSLGFVPAALLTLVMTAVLGAILYLVVFRPLRDAPPLARAVASLGVLIIIQELMAIRLGTAPVSVASIFPSKRWEIGGATVLSDRLYLAIAVVALTVAITALYRWTRFGLSTRAAAETQTGAYISGVSPDRVALLNWMISAAVAGAAGILIAPLAPLTPLTYTLFVIPALAAAVVGAFSTLVPTVLAGIAIGMFQSEASSLAAQHSWLPRTGASELVPLIVILVALLATGRAMPVRGLLLRHPLGRAPRPRGLTLPTVVGFLVGVLALLVTDGNWRAAVIGTFIAGVIALSLVVVTGYAGQVSLAQLALAGAGAFTLSGLTQSWHVPFPFAPILAALMATVIGVLVGLPALRLRGLTLGVVTLALAYAIEAVWFRNTQIVSTSGGVVTQPKLFGLDLGVGTGKAFPRFGFGLLCLVVLVAVAWFVARLRTSKLGSAMLAVRANERSASGIGVNVVFVKVMSFAIASFIAGLGGSLLAYRRGVVTFDSFSTIGNLTLLSTAYLAGVTSVYGGVLAGILAAGGVVFYATDQWIDLGKWFPTISAVLVIVTVISNPEGLAAGGHALADRLARFRRPRRAAEPVPEPETAGAVAASTTDEAEPSEPPERERVLDVEHLTVRYGGVVAVNDVSLQVDAGSVVGLIGPNGAGKTSVIDAITGFARADGTVRVLGRNVENERPHQRVRAGLARTFQSLELYDDLTVDENVGAAAAGVGQAVTRALDLVGIAKLADRPAGELSQGERQLVSIARACAADPKLLLLDEPAAGLDTTETKWLGERIRTIASTGVGMLLVDHDVSLVLSVCDYIYVLDFGKVIAAGDPAAIRADRTVAAAYLGKVHDASMVDA
jgi:ABC-type branched-subunit amino acid transport system ATPase component/ABC-type branched-subunit amino acid transport system permease subunit